MWVRIKVRKLCGRTDLVPGPSGEGRTRLKNHVTEGEDKCGSILRFIGHVDEGSLFSE